VATAREKLSDVTRLQFFQGFKGVTNTRLAHCGRCGVELAKGKGQRGIFKLVGLPARYKSNDAYFCPQCFDFLVKAVKSRW